MRLESITLHGFKSFSERTEVEVLPGITCIVGPNGCGKCLEGSSLVTLADGRQVPIGVLVEDALREGPVHRLDDGVVGSGRTDVQILTLDPVTLKLQPRRVDAFIQRTAPPFLLRVRTRSGREVVTTHYHPFFGLADGRLTTLTAEQLRAGVHVAMPRRLPAKSAPIGGLDAQLLAAVRSEDRLYVSLSPALRGWLRAAAERRGGFRALAAEAGVPVRHLDWMAQGRRVAAAALRRVVEAAGALPMAIEEIGSGRSTIKVPAAIDARLARFLGYLIAEGRNTSSRQVWFVNSDAAITAEYGRLASDLFGVAPRQFAYKAGVTDTIVFSKALGVMLDRLFGVRIGGGSAEKIVPPQLWTADDDVVAAFLSGLFEGDAFVHEARTPRGTAMPYFEYVTASRPLAEGVVTLLLRLGVLSLLRVKRKYASNTTARRRRTYYSVYVYGTEQARRLASRLEFVGGKRARLDAVRSLPAADNPNLDVVPNVTSLIRAAASRGGVSVKRLRKASPKLAAYTEARCAASREGLGEIVWLIERFGASPGEAAPLLRRLHNLAESDVYWDQVAAVERIAPTGPWVYDLSVADTHNFVAANFIVHNSNISDAVRWALGEQSAKSLRGQKMEDVIFYGSASRKAVSLAEVELKFSNEDAAVAVPWSEIAVARRLYRTGESEYLLNKTVTRLRDILDLFAGTGANPRAYSVMDQDKLNHVLTAKPHERRVFIEEAAGIARYKQQRNETQGKLEAARQNLVRVKDVMDEVKRQLGSLERQARKAQQYKALESERRNLRLTLVAADHAALVAEGERLEGELTGRRQREEELRVRQSHLGAREASQRELIQASDHRLGDFRQSLQKVQAEMERLLERREQMGAQLREAAEEGGRLDEEIRVTTERLAAIVGEREATRVMLAETERLVGERTEAALMLEDQVARHRAGLLDERGRLEALRLEQVRLAGERTDLTRSAGELRERALQLSRRAERLAAELVAAEAEA
ncbi:MAG: LAGLIDADG family homing endonuclease, partial [Candidatus Rokuibacteriota bacterium]